jgi:hypothetical protein
VDAEAAIRKAGGFAVKFLPFVPVGVPVKSVDDVHQETGIQSTGRYGMLAATKSRVAGFALLITAWVVVDRSRGAVPQQPAQAEVKSPAPTPIAIKKDELGTESWNPAWDKTIEQALPPELLSKRVARSVKPFCARFMALPEVDKRAFWAYFFQALAGAEAGLVPTTEVRHTEPEVAVKDTVSNRMVRSEGLLQLTYMDVDRYGCAFDWDKDKRLPEKDPQRTILRPENNLLCGIRILKNQLIDKKKPLVSSSSYWSTLRPGTISYQAFVKQMANVPDVCRLSKPVAEAKNASPGPDK